jgi:hypothetical protein
VSVAYDESVDSERVLSVELSLQVLSMSLASGWAYTEEDESDQTAEERDKIPRENKKQS